MGLDINDYSASYSQLHRLRAWALRVEKNKLKLSCKDFGKMENCGECVYCKLADVDTIEEIKKITLFYEFINHSDCGGGYIDLEELGLGITDGKKFRIRKGVEWGDLGELKKEVKQLDKHSRELKDWDKQTWDAFRDDVLNARGILEFH